MLFSGSAFLLYFLPSLFIIYYLIPKERIRGKNCVLIVSSTLFYAFGGLRFLPLLFGSAILDYVSALAIEKAPVRMRRAVMAASVAVSIASLGVFKYAGFFARIAGLGDPGIALPVGISFFTFQGISYVIDVYRGGVKAEKNPFRVILYVILFPQLVAGPIVRYRDVSDAIAYRTHELYDVAEGCCRFTAGLGKKLIIADAVGEIADSVFAAGAGQLGVGTAWLGALAYTLEIYYDFSAYSDMAIGLGAMWGFKFPENFDYPYTADSVTDFWRRWHMTLSSWFRDYVYIPLGGNRVGKVRHIFNLLVVWALTGLWHGADFTFALWGIYYGVILILEKYITGKYLDRVPSPLRHAATLLVIVVGWVIFRADSVTGAWEYLCAMTGGGERAAHVNDAVYYIREYLPELILALVFCFPSVKKLRGYCDERGGWRHTAFDTAEKLLSLIILVISYFRLVSGSFNPFIYFKF